MSYFFEELTDIKLLVIKTIEYFRDAIPENILVDTILTNDYANFFDIQQAIFELTENKLVTYFEDESGRRYRLTAMGETALEGFSARIPKSVCEKLYQTVRIKIREFENDLNLIADYERGSDMEYVVKLGIMEGGYEIFTVSLSIFDEKMARNICREFKRNPQTLYNEILAVLLNENSEG